MQASAVAHLGCEDKVSTQKLTGWHSVVISCCSTESFIFTEESCDEIQFEMHSMNKFIPNLHII